MTPYYKKINISYDKNIVEYIFPDPKSFTWIAKDETEALRFKIIFIKNPFENAKKIKFLFNFEDELNTQYEY